MKVERQRRGTRVICWDKRRQIIYGFYVAGGVTEDTEAPRTPQ